MKATRSGLIVACMLGAAVLIVRWLEKVNSSILSASSEQQVEHLQGGHGDPRLAPPKTVLADAGRVDVVPTADDERQGGANVAVPEQDELEIHVIDGVGQPVSGAGVFRIQAVEWQKIGTTDAEGRLEVMMSPSPRDGCEVVAEKLGYAQARRWLVRDDEREIVLRMMEPGILAGRVTTADGLAVPGIVVLAVDSHVVLSSMGVAGRMLGGDPTAPVALTDDRGSFSIGSLSAARSYRVFGGGNGSVLLGPRNAFTPTRTDLSFIAAPLYGFTIDLLGPDGAGIRVCPDMIVYSDARYLGTANPPAPVGEADALLAGVPSSSVRAQAGHFYFFYAPSEQQGASSLGPFEFSATIPGYEPIRVEAWATPVATGIEQYSAILTSHGECRGGLEVEIRGLPPPSPGAVVANGLARLVLYPSGGESRVELLLQEDRRASRLLTELPCGSYEARLQGCSGYFFWPFDSSIDRKVVIVEEGAGPPARLDVDLTRCGTLLVTPVLADGTVYDGALGIELHPERPHSDALQTIWLERPPYRLAGLYVGMQQDHVDYAIMAYVPSLSEETSALVGEVVAPVMPGRASEVTVELK